SWRLGSMLFLLLPVALAGAVLAGLAQGAATSTVALLGILTVLGVLARHAILAIRRYEDLVRENGRLDADLVVRGSRDLFARIVMPVLGTAVALAPLAIVGPLSGLEVLQPLAVIILGGLVTAALVSLFVLPTLYLRVATVPRPEPNPQASPNPASA